MFGVLYWAVWKLVLPYVFKFRLVPRKEVLKDGTVVTLVSLSLCRCCICSSGDRGSLRFSSLVRRWNNEKDCRKTRDDRFAESTRQLIVGTARY
jgi:hypothetical protein